MIGVAVRPSKRDIVMEFFELFKTSWEFCRAGEQYEVMLCTSDISGTNRAETSRLLLLFEGEPFDTQHRIQTKSQPGGVAISDEGKRLPIYENLITYPGGPNSLLKEEATQEPAAFIVQRGGTTALHIGRKLFTRFVIYSPLANRLPTPEFQPWTSISGGCAIGLLWQGSVAGEPPVPDSYNFVSCLRHDIDHPALRNHRCDHTMFGFLCRSTIGTLVNVCLGRKPFKRAEVVREESLCL